MSKIEMVLGDCLEWARSQPDNSFDSCVTDPPAGVAFMGKAWDTFAIKARGGFKNGTGTPAGFAAGVKIDINPAAKNAFIAFLIPRFAEALRILKPGGYALVWALPRTSHWTGWALEEAGFIVKDCVTHLFGCLSEDTEILTDKGWVQYHKCDTSNLALCYNVESDYYEWQPIKEVFIYDYKDTAYHVKSDSTDQIISRNHRAIVERDGRKTFQFAEALQRQENVPVLENLQDLLKSIPMPKSHPGPPKQLLQRLRAKSHERSQQGPRIKTLSDLPGLQKRVQAEKQNSFEQSQVLQLQMSGYCASTDQGYDSISGKGPGRLDRQKPSILQNQHGRGQQPSMERRGNFQTDTWELQGGKVCSVSGGISSDGPYRQLRNGTSFTSSKSNRPSITTLRSSASHRPQPGQQQTGKPDVISLQPGTQEIRRKITSQTSTTLATVTPIYYEGKVWCIQVPFGAFVARRNGKIFVTGNSGYPKNYNIAKGIEQILTGGHAGNTTFHKLPGINGEENLGKLGFNKTNFAHGHQPAIYTAHGSLELEATTDEAKAWEGFGTALKPASEHWWLVQKPLEPGGYARNVLKWGVGGLNIKACSVGSEEIEQRMRGVSTQTNSLGGSWNATNPGEKTGKTRQGRWPPNLLLSHTLFCTHTGSKEIGKGSEKKLNRSRGGWVLDGSSQEFTANAPDNYGLETVEVWDCAPGCPVREINLQSGVTNSSKTLTPKKRMANNKIYGAGLHGDTNPDNTYEDSGGASRFFPNFSYDEDERALFYYLAKPSKAEKAAGLDGFELSEKVFNGQSTRPSTTIKPGSVEDKFSTSPTANSHPTVKGQKLCSWLLKLITPPGGRSFDLFAGSGSTGIAAVKEGFDWVGVELDPTYFKIAKARIEFAKLPKEVQAAKPNQTFIDWFRENY